MREEKITGILIFVYGLIHILWIIAIVILFENGWEKIFGIIYMTIAMIFFIFLGSKICSNDKLNAKESK